MEQKDEEKKYVNILSPLEGKIVPLESIRDLAFSSKAMGDGAAIIPTGNKIFSPVGGVVDTVSETLHAVGIISDNGINVLIHVGQDTVKLKGKYFKAYVKEGDRVKAGEPLIKFNLKKIKKLGYDTTTPVVIVDSDEYSNVSPIKIGNSKIGGILIKIQK